jgi:hypothetical protein
MPNGNAAWGLTPRRQRSGETENGSLNEYYVDPAYATALFPGDPVILSGSGSPEGVPGVVAATQGATNRITGVVVGFRPAPVIVAQGYLPASTGGYVLVSDNPDTEYEIQEDGVGGTLAVTSIGLISAAGSPFLKRSGWMLDSSTAGTGATLQVRILGLEQRADNELGQYAKWIVRLNLPTEMGISSGVGV